MKGLMTRKTFSVLMFVAGMSLVGCGGNGSSSGGTTTPPVTQGSPQGVYSGSTSTAEAFESIILPDNTFYALYGTSSGNIFTVRGMITGQGAYTNGKYTATVTDYYYTGATYTGSVSATYVVGSSISGTVSETGNANVTFSGTPLASSAYVFGAPALLSNITGTWTGYLFGNAEAEVTVAANGTFTGSSQGCTFSGTVVSDSSGSNFFDFTIKYGGSPCLLANQTQTGVAVDYLLPDGVTRQLLAGMSSATSGNVFIANRASSTSSSGNISFVQSSNFTSQSTVSNPSSKYTGTFTSPVRSGDLVAVAFWWNFAPGSSIVSVTDSAGNAYFPVVQTSSVDSNDWAGWIYAAPNVTGADALSVTVTVSYANADQFSMAILEYSNVGNFDVTSTAGGTSGMTVSSGSVVTNHANELILGVAVADVNLVAGSGFNSRFCSSDYFCVEDKIVAMQGTYDANFVTSNTIQNEGWDAAMASFY
jgi:hypothetical protein